MIQLSWYLIFMNVTWKALRSNASIHNNFICWRTLSSACSSLLVHDRSALSQGFLACLQTFLIHLTFWNCLVHKTSKFKNNNTCPSKDTLTANTSVQKGVNLDENEMFWELIDIHFKWSIKTFFLSVAGRSTRKKRGNVMTIGLGL
jgi:hypothetical protein